MTVRDYKDRIIGKVTSVNADRFVVELLSNTDTFTVIGFDDIHYVAQLGSFLMLPVAADFIVGEVTGLWQRDPGISPNRSNPESTNVLATSPRYLEVVPVGMLPISADKPFSFGVSAYPSLYSDALYIQDSELDRIFDVATAEENVPEGRIDEWSLFSEHDFLSNDEPPTRLRALTVGQSVVFRDYSVKVKVDEFFGGHTAILGNTGSGKSCTVATILQSAFEKPSYFSALGATFLFLDVNGEYRRAFSELPDVICRRYCRVLADTTANPPAPLDTSESTHTFRLPHWFMSVQEWELLLRASERTQQPVLRTALGLTSLFAEDSDDILGLRNHILASCITQILSSDASSPTKKDRITALLSSFRTDEINLDWVRDLIAIDYGELSNAEQLGERLDEFIIDGVTMPDYQNAPFAFSDLEKALDLALLYEEAHGNNQIRDYCAQLLTRFKWVKERQDFEFLRQDLNDLEDWEKEKSSFVSALLGVSEGGVKESQITIIDMNEAEDEVVEVVSAVICRLVLERLRVAKNRNSYPVNLVLEEAHRYVSAHSQRSSIDATRIFERAAKEGRKYGLFLTIASQRPSELSKTALSQCSNFIVHRIQNPDDLLQIRQMTPYISESVLRRLPSLPKQHALIFGNAVNIPTTFKVRTVSPVPLSDDADVSDLWYRPIDVVELS